jgi:diacylglycerol kinase (ATP)
MKSFPSQMILAESPGTHVPVQLDSEVWGRLPMSFRSEPAALRVIR